MERLYAIKLEVPAVVVGLALHQRHLAPWHTADGAIPALANAHVQVARVEAVVVTVQRWKVLDERDGSSHSF